MSRNNHRVPLKSTEIQKLFVAWGWQEAHGSKHFRFRKGTNYVTMSRSSVTEISFSPVRQAAKVDGVGIDHWLRGPDKPMTRTVSMAVSEEDLDFFVHRLTDLHPMTADEALRMKTITLKLKDQGTLGQWKKAQDKALAGKTVDISQHQETVPEKVENVEGCISLDEALELRELQQGTLSWSSCVLLAVLAEDGTIEEPKGKATAVLLERMGSRGVFPAGLKRSKTPMGLTNLLSKWEDAGVISRKITGKRCYSIALTVPIRLTEEERAKYLKPTPEQKAKARAAIHAGLQGASQAGQEMAREIKTVVPASAEVVSPFRSAAENPLSVALDVLKEKEGVLSSELAKVRQAISAIEDLL